MALQTDVNNLPTTGSECIFILKELLKTAGYTVPASSDGTTYNAAGDQITVAGSGAGGMDNNRAWFRIQDPAGEREWTFQRATTLHYQWRVKYSALDGFTGGSPGITETPSATDEAILFGGGTDASPTFPQMFNVTPGRWHVIAEDAANARGVYWWIAVEVPLGSASVDTMLLCEAINPNTTPPLVGTRATPTTGDPDPCVVGASFNGSGGLMQIQNGLGWNSTTNPTISGWFGMNGTNGQSEAFVGFAGANYHLDNSPAAFIAPATGVGSGVGINPYSGNDEGFPILIARGGTGFASQLGFKGASENIRMKGVNRAYPDTINLSSGSYVYFEDLLVPWEDGTAPLT